MIVKANQPQRAVTFAEQIGLLRRAMRRALVRRLSLESDRPLQQLLALRSIARKEVHTQAELSVRLLIDAPAASRLVGQLEADGLLKRVKGRDRREVRLKVTAAASGEIKAIQVGLSWLDAQLLGLLGAAGFKATMRSMVKMQAGLATFGV